MEPRLGPYETLPVISVFAFLVRKKIVFEVEAYRDIETLRNAGKNGQDNHYA
jgi:hypothetical protein